MSGPDDPRVSRDVVDGSSLLPLPPASSELTPFEVQVPEQAVNDLHSRLRSVRWPRKDAGRDREVDLAGVERARTGRGTLQVDHPPINLLDGMLIVGLDRFGREVVADPDVRAVVIDSANPEFSSSMLTCTRSSDGR
jgi:hypothetical protein